MSEAWNCQKGASLLIPSGPENKKHLFALMLDPVLVDGYGSKPRVLLACVTSVQHGMPGDDSCLLGPGDHPFIEHDSYVDYRFTRLEPVEHLQGRVQEGTFIAKEPCSLELIKRIIRGALKSRRIPREFKLLLEKVLFD
ncbi:hypothetical protein [Polaromonas sp. CG_23.6]|uniref:hypothetical protein n=1 Tax=Polaromonas sp. CG_23.6 TaxID=2760709 RepID=UPI002473A9E1|nr:hypothetical protein [Polaromonas sp. CG_23.6]MDH6185469.1 hypothetical protein [Polaromonas sp. CG_23.6]